MTKQKRTDRSQPASVGVTAAAPQSAGEDLESLEGNAATQDRARAKQAPGPPPGDADPMDDATSGAPSGLPHRDAAEAALGADLSGVEAHTGQADALDPIDARAAARPGEVAFADANPDVETVIEESAHALQFENAGGGGGDAISNPNSAAEREAKGIAASAVAGKATGAPKVAARGVHRDEKGPGTPARPEDKASLESIEATQFLVFPDAEWATSKDKAPKGPDAVGKPTWIDRTAFTKKKRLVEDTKQADVLVQQIAAALAGATANDVPKKVRAVLPAFTPGARALAFQNESLWASKALADPKIAAALASALDPVEELRTILRSGSMVARFSLEQWAKSYPDYCDRALADGGIQVLLTSEMGASSVESRLVLMAHGDWRANPRDSLYIAIDKLDAPAFETAWRALKKADPATAGGLLNDPLFLMKTRETLPEAFAVLLADLRSFGVEKPPAPGELGDFESATLGPQAKETAPQIEKAAASGDGSGAIAAATKYRTLAFALLKHHDGTDEGKSLRIANMSEAMKLLVGQMEPAWFGKLQCVDDLQDRGKEEDAARLSKLLETATYEVGKLFVAFSQDLTPQDRAWLAVEIPGRVAQISGLILNPFKSTAFEINAQLRAFQKGCIENIRSEAPDDHEARWAVGERRRKAALELDAAFEKSAGFGLAQVIAMQGDKLIGGLAQGVLSYLTTEQVLEDDPDLYSPELTDLDRERLSDVWRDLGKAMNSEFHEVYTDDDDALSLFRQLRDRHAEILRPKKPTKESWSAYEDKKVAAMVEFEAWYNRVYEGLQHEINDHVGDPEMTEILAIVRIRRDENQVAVQQMLMESGGQQGDIESQSKVLEAYRSQCQRTAHELEGALGRALEKETDLSMFSPLLMGVTVDFAGLVSDKEVLRICRSFKVAREAFVTAMGPQYEAEAGKFLLREFTARGGRIQPAIRRGLSDENAEQAFALLGIEGGAGPVVDVRADVEGLEKTEQEAAKAEGDKKQVDVVTFEKEMGPRIDLMSNGLAAGPPKDKDGTGALLGYAGTAQTWAKVITAHARTYQDGMALLRQVWANRCGITLEADVGLHLSGMARVLVVKAFGLDEASLPKPRGNSFMVDPEMLKAATEIGMVERDRDPLRPEAMPEDLRFYATEVTPGFTLDEATRRAKRLHDLAAALPKTEAQVQAAMVGEGSKKETQVVLACYKRIFGYDLKYQLKQVFKDAPEEVERYEEWANTAGNLGFVAEMREYARVGDNEAARKAALKATPAQQKALLADGVVLTELRKAFGHRNYDILYRAITNQIRLYELQADRGDGWGTDEEGTRTDIKHWFEHHRVQMMHDDKLRLASGGDPKKLKELVEEKMIVLARQTYADPNVIEMIRGEFSSDEKFEIEAIVIGGGEKGADDTVIYDLVGVGTGDDVTKHLAAMSDEERKKRRNDPLFQEFLADDLDNNDAWEQKQSFAELYADQAKNQSALLYGVENDIDKTKQQSQYQDGYGNKQIQEQMSATSARKVMDKVLAMDEVELEAFRQDRVHVQKIRALLDPESLARFDAFLSAAHGAVTKTGGLDVTDDAARKKQKAAFLVEQNVGRFQQAVQAGADAILAAAQDAFCEKGQIAVAKKDAQGQPTATQEVVETFGKPERKLVWGRIATQYGKEVRDGGLSMGLKGGKVYNIVRDSLLAHENPSNDPAAFRFEWADADLGAIIGMENDEAAMAAITKASPRFVAAEWSTVGSVGRHGETPMKTLYQDYRAQRDQFVSQQKAYQAAKEKGTLREADEFKMSEALDLAGRRMILAQDTYTRHAIVVSKKAWDLIADGDTHAQGDDNDRIQALEGKIVALTPSDIAPIVGLDKNDPYFDADAATLNSADRQTRSTYAHDKEQYTRQDGSIVDSFTDADEKMDLSFLLYTGEIGDATAGAGWDIGTITEEEKARIDDRKGDFDQKLKEYKEAKSRFAEILKWIAIAIITIVATALTGPGGPTLLAALLTGAATGVAKAGIDELVQGNDYDFAEDGLKTILVETVTSVATVGLGKAIKFAGGKFPGVQDAITKYDKFVKWEEAVKEGATKSLPGFVGNLVYEGGKAVVMAPMSTLTDAAIGSLDLSYWKYGTATGVTHTQDVFDEKIGGMGEDLQTTLITTLVNNVADVGVSKLFPKGAADKTIEGLDIEDKVADKNSLALEVALATAKVASPEALTKTIKTQGVKVLVTKMMSGDMLKASGWNETDLTAFLQSIAMDRLDAAVTGAAGAIQQWNVDKLKGDRMKTAEADLGAVITDPDELAAALAHYENYLDNDAHMYGTADELGVDPKQWATTEWKSFTKTLDRQVDLSVGNLDPKGKDDYRKWLLSDPEQTVMRMYNTDYKSFTKAHQEARNDVVAIKASDSYRALSAFDKRYYDSYLADPTRMITDKGTAESSIDIRDPKKLETFKRQVQHTRVVQTRNGAYGITSTWSVDDRGAFDTWLTANPDKLKYMSPTDETNNEVIAEGLAVQWMKDRKAPTGAAS